MDVHEDLGIVRIDGYLQCLGDVILEVTKELALSRDSNGRWYVRGYRYRYVGRVVGRCLLLKYHNRHADPNQYIHRVYFPETGDQAFKEILRRDQFPTFPEVLSELAELAQQVPPAA